MLLVKRTAAAIATGVILAVGPITANATTETTISMQVYKAPSGTTNQALYQLIAAGCMDGVLFGQLLSLSGAQPPVVYRAIVSRDTLDMAGTQMTHETLASVGVPNGTSFVRVLRLFVKYFGSECDFAVGGIGSGGFR